jgi:cytoskeletal protein RodZ
MENTNNPNRKRIILIATAILIVILTIISIVILINRKDSNTPTTTKVEPGQTITQQQIEQDNLDGSSSQSNSGTTSPSPSATPQATPTSDDFYNVIAKSNSVATDGNGQASFGITNTQNPIPGWYIVTIKSGSLEPAKVILHQTNDSTNPLAIIAGPGTYFPDSIALPDAVRKAL